MSQLLFLLRDCVIGVLYPAGYKTRESGIICNKYLHLKNHFLIAFFLLCSVTSFSQFRYTAAKVQNIAGTYTDLGSSGAAITTNFTGGAMTFDNANSAIQNIGFNF